MWNLKNKTNKFVCKMEKKAGIENNLVVTKGRRKWGDKL